MAHRYIFVKCTYCGAPDGKWREIASTQGGSAGHVPVMEPWCDHCLYGWLTSSPEDEAMPDAPSTQEADYVEQVEVLQTIKRTERPDIPGTAPPSNPQDQEATAKQTAADGNVEQIRKKQRTS